MTSFRDRGLALVNNGYQIIPIPARTKAPVEDTWQEIRADTRLVESWAANGYADGNIGVLTRRNPGVDLDIFDPGFAKEMTQVVERIVQSPLALPIRIGRAPKRLLLFCTAEPFPKVASPFFMSPDGKKHRVEVLGDGQQFVAFGIHPDTGQEFSWVSSSTPLNTPTDELPSLSHAQARRIVAEFVVRADERQWKRVALAFKGSFNEIEDSSEPSGIDMRPKLRVTADDVREALTLMDGFDDYETWFRVGMGLHHQFAGSDEGLAIWLEWSSQWAEYKRKKGEKAARYRWGESFKEVRDGGHGPITVAFIIKHANARRREQEEAAFNELQGKVSSALDFQALIGPVAKQIAATELSPMQRAVLTKMMQKAARKFTGVSVAIKDIAATTKPHATDEGSKARSFEELEVTLARRVLRTRFEDGAHIKRFSKMWFTYQAGVWRREEDEFIERCVLETLTDLRRINDKMLRELLDQMDESRGDRLNALIGTISSVISKLVAEQGNNDPLGLNSFDAPRVINCTNLEVWIDDDGGATTQPHNPVHLLTSQIACDYTPLATCPTWDEAVRKVFQDFRDPINVIRHFYEVLGYIMQPSRESALWVMLKGAGDNGKSFLISLIAEIMGRTSVIAKSIAEIATNANTHFTTALVGKLMLLDDDLKAHTILPDDWLKKLSEAKLLTADPKFGQTFEFIARAIPVILTNPWPATSDLSEGLRRRVQVFEFTHILTDAEKDPSHLRTIRSFEMPGILLRLIGGMQRFLARGGKFDTPSECLDSKARWLSSSNTTMRFLEECVERRGASGPRGSVRASDLYDHYIQWLRHWEISARPLGRNKFYEAMDALRLKRVNHANVAYYSGLKLKALDMGFDDLDGDDGLGGDGL
jgi:P4 family phage/plasmid primase-like protien